MISISDWRSPIIFCFSYSSAVIAATSRLSSSLTCSMRVLIADFLSFNYLFSLLRLMKRPRSPSIPIFLFSSMLPPSSTTFWRKFVYSRRSSKSLDLSWSLIFFFSMLCFSWKIFFWCSFAVVLSYLRRSSSFFRFCWFFRIYCLSAAMLARTSCCLSRKLCLSWSNCLAFEIISYFC